MGSAADGRLERGTLEVAGVRRSYWLARSRETPAARGPLLIMLHGSGTTGRDMATTFTDLASRGPAAGVAVVFPDGWRGVWHIARPPPGEPDLDDAAFLAALAGRLAGSAGAGSLFLAGLSNGAGFAEHVARHGHGWPGGPQYLPVRMSGPIPRQLDATGILLDMVTAGAARA
jgi:polyhydroxybutyrate depolymerase